MKYKIFIDKTREEEILIYAHKKTKMIDEIENIILSEGVEITAYKNNETFKLSPLEICCFSAEDNRVFAFTMKDKFQIKQRLYQLDEILNENFIKINKSCIINIKCIKKFDASLSGNLCVTLENGFKDYVSRRNLKSVKERLGVR